MKRTIFKGWHMSWFPWPKRLKGNSHTFTISIEHPDMWKYEFLDLTATYDLEDGTEGYVYEENQWDWNKLIGVKKNLF